MTHDPINSPDHYKAGMPDGVEVIDIIQAQQADFLHGSAIKYILRWKYKNGLGDLRKAHRVLQMLIVQEEERVASVERPVVDDRAAFDPFGTRLTRFAPPATRSDT